MFSIFFIAKGKMYIIDSRYCLAYIFEISKMQFKRETIKVDYRAEENFEIKNALIVKYDDKKEKYIILDKD